jgi:hypothetical protein
MNNRVYFYPSAKFEMSRYVETGEIRNTSDNLLNGLRIDLKDSETATPSFLSMFEDLMRSNNSDRCKIQSLIKTRDALENDLRVELKLQRDSHDLISQQDKSQGVVIYCGATWNPDALRELKDIADKLVQYNLTVIANIESYLQSLYAAFRVTYSAIKSWIYETYPCNARMLSQVINVCQAINSPAGTIPTNEIKKKAKSSKKKYFLNF